MTLSIIIPVYNAEQYLHECLNSVFSQKLDSFEVICVDDGSSDNSAEIIRHFQQLHPNLVLIQQENRGPSAARNTGINNATGNYIFFLDNDDTFLTNYSLQEIVSIAEKESVDLFVFNALIDGNRSFLSPFPSSKEILSGPELMTLFYKTCNSLMIPIWGHLYRREYLLNNGLFFNEKFLVEDILFNPIVQYNAKRALCQDIPIINYRWLRPGAITTSASLKNLIDRRNSGRELYQWFSSRKTLEDAPYQTIFSVYTELIHSIIDSRLKPSTILDQSDYIIMHNCIRTIRDRICYRLVRINPKLMIRYLDNTLPQLLRKIINRFL